MPGTSTSSLSTYTTMMRLTTTGRPYAQDLHDMFAACVIQHGLRDHRYRFRTYPASFLIEEAIQVLGNLQFTHVMRTPDPKNPARMIATRTTTTFSMSPDMGRTLAQHFITSRLVENALDASSRVARDKGIWVLTPKGKHAILDFSSRAQVSIDGMKEPLSKLDSFSIVVLERLAEHDDKLAFARPNMTIVFKTLMAYLPMEPLLADDAGGIEKKNLETYRYTFFGYQCFEWISEYTTVVTREEAELVASELVLYGWISQILDKSDRANSTRDDSIVFKMGRSTLYYVTDRGRCILGWEGSSVVDTASDDSILDQEGLAQQQRSLANRLRYGDSSKKRQPSSNSSHKHDAPPSSSATSSSSASTISNEELCSPPINGGSGPVLAAGDHIEVEFPTNVGKKPSAPEVRNDLDKVTERLLQLRSPSSQTDNDSASSSRPSSMILSTSLCNPDTDFITSAPLDSPLDPHSHWSKLRQILEDPLSRMYFRDFVKSQFCEENVNIWVAYHNLRRKCSQHPKRHKELLRDTYAIYDTYLSPTAATEVNIDFGLRQEIIAYVTDHFVPVHHNRTVDGHVPFVSNGLHHTPQQVTIIVNGHTAECLRTLLKLYDRVNEHICRIMAQDSVPKFIKTEKYKNLMSKTPPPPATRRESIDLKTAAH